MSLNDFLDWYEADYATTHPTTTRKLKSELRLFRKKFGTRPVDSIQTAELLNYRKERMLVDRKRPETVGKEIRRLITAFRYGVKLRVIDHNPCEGLQAPRGAKSTAVRFFTAAQLDHIYAVAGKRAPIWKLMANTGLRRGEMLKLCHSDVHGDTLYIESVPDEETGEGRTKSGQWRSIPLNDAAREAIAMLPGDPMVRAAAQRKRADLDNIHADTLTEWFTKDAREAGVKGNLHMLRHTFCSHLAMAGVSLRQIQMLAGHSDYKQTETYAHLCPRGADEAVAKIAL